MRLILTYLAGVFLCAWASFGQVNSGELRLRVTDAAGAGVSASVTIVSQGNQFQITVATNERGAADIRRLPYGIYLISVHRQGFTPFSIPLPVESAIPLEYAVKLAVAPVETTVAVNAAETLIDPHVASSIMQIGSRQIEDRVQALPGRSVQDLVNSQPGWLYEGNAVLHPRGSEYQTQLVIDGIPLTDNRSPGFGPEIGADDLESVSIYSAGFPAEYGRKMGGVVELNTKRNPNQGLHGQLILSGGTYDTLGSYGQIQQAQGKNTLTVTASGSGSSHYLNPVVPENYTNRGTTGDFSVKYERDFDDHNRLIMSVRHELARFEIPNEQVQQDGGQLQTGNNFETLGTVHYQHIFSADSLGSLEGMVRDNAHDLDSNAKSTPIVAFQKNDFREGYLKATYSLHSQHQEWKAGVESDTTFLQEHFHYLITDPDQFDPSTPASLAFSGNRPNLEQSAFAEDLLHFDKWTLSAGLRWDHYQLLLNQNSFSPRLSVGRYFPSARMVVHASYDRVFQTPSSENILISSSPQIAALNNNFLRLPVQPSNGNYYEGGLAEALGDRMRADLNVYRRTFRNYADDDQLLNTGVSYPIAFNKGIIYGAEGKLEVVRLQSLTGYVSYSYMVGKVWFPVTGGLFLGDDANAALSQLHGHFPDSQDQRNTVRTRFQYQAAPCLWLATGASYGSGLPFEYGGDQADALALYGPAVVRRINFDRERIRPVLAVNASLNLDVYKSDKMTARLQLDGDNLNDRLNVIDFHGLFSGTAIAPGRSWSLRLAASF